MIFQGYVFIYLVVWIGWFLIGLMNLLMSDSPVRQNDRLRKATQEEIQSKERWAARATIYSVIWPIVTAVAILVSLAKMVHYVFRTAGFGRKK